MAFPKKRAALSQVSETAIVKPKAQPARCWFSWSDNCGYSRLVLFWPEENLVTLDLSNFNAHLSVLYALERAEEKV